jgi:hypothetical protein
MVFPIARTNKKALQGGRRMSLQNQLRGDSISWLLEPKLPGVRYLALRDVVGLSDEDAELKSAWKLVHYL